MIASCGCSPAPAAGSWTVAATWRAAPLDPLCLVWNGGTVGRIAAGIYEERAFDRLPILADALEDAGCTDPALLTHCRGPGPHVRGCWAVDLLRPTN